MNWQIGYGKRNDIDSNELVSFLFVIYDTLPLIIIQLKSIMNKTSVRKTLNRYHHFKMRMIYARSKDRKDKLLLVILGYIAIR